MTVNGILLRFLLQVIIPDIVGIIMFLWSVSVGWEYYWAALIGAISVLGSSVIDSKLFNNWFAKEKKK